MLLSDRDILFHIEKKDITLIPFDISLLQPASIDVTLNNKFRIFKNYREKYIKPYVNQSSLSELIVSDNSFILHPNEFVLASTYERLELTGKCAARFEGKSSLGRLGLLTHATAGFIDPGFKGTITLELSNMSNLPIEMLPGMLIGQLCFFKLSSEPLHLYGDKEYNSKYQNQESPTSSKSYIKFKKKDI